MKESAYICGVRLFFTAGQVWPDLMSCVLASPGSPVPWDCQIGRCSIGLCMYLVLSTDCGLAYDQSITQQQRSDSMATDDMSEMLRH